MISVIMGSDSDWPVMQPACEVLQEFSIVYEARVVSAHRTPLDMAEFGRTALTRGIQIIIAGAGGAAHLPGMMAAHTVVPVIGVPIPTRHLGGLDSLYSIVQMPTGVPVATVAIGNARNAGLLAIAMLAIHDPRLQEQLVAFRENMATQSRAKTGSLTLHGATNSPRVD